MQFVVQTTWGHLVAWYLFLAGVGAGVYLIGIGAKIWCKNASFAKFSYYASPGLVIVGCLFLLFDLGQPVRAVLTILRPHSSMISVGTIILSLFIAVGLVQGHYSFRGRLLPPVWDYTGLVLAVGTASYTGLLLGIVKAIPFWNNPLLPILFLVSAISSGAGFLLIFAALCKPPGEGVGALISQVVNLDAVLIFIEAGFLSALLLIAANGNVAAATSAHILMTGTFATPFWLIVVGLGMVLPLMLKLAVRTEQLQGMVLYGAGLMAGALALRYGIVVSGVWVSIGG